MKRSGTLLALALVSSLLAPSCRAPEPPPAKKARLRSKRPVPPREPRKSRELLGWVTFVDGDPLVGGLLDVDPAKLPEYIERLYRLKPDRRLLYAVAETRRILGGPVVPEVTYRFLNGSWSIRLGETEVGTLPEIPTYADARKLLASWAEREWRRAGRSGAAGPAPGDVAALAGPLGAGGPEDVLKSLRSLDALWKASPGNPRLVREAARGFAWLGVQTLDDLDLADPLLGKAWALLSLAQHVEPKGLAAEEALLAESLGYETGALAAAEKLPANDPVRLYVEHETARLEGVAKAARGRRAEYLYALRLAETRKSADWYSWFSASSLGREESLATLKAALLLEDFGPDFEQFDATRALVVSQLLPAGDAGRAIPAERQLLRLETELSRRAAESAGTLLDRESFEALHRAALYSAIHGTARYYLDRLSSDEAAGQYVRSIVDPPPGIAAELVRWMTDRLALRADTRKVKAIVDDLVGFEHLRGWPLYRMRYSLDYATAATASDRRRPMPAYFGHLDTRPVALLEAYWVSVRMLVDPERAAALLAASAAEAPFRAGDLEASAAYQRRDEKRLRRIAASLNRPPASRGQALRYLVRLDARNLGPVRADYERLMCEHTESGLLAGWVETLTKAKDLPGALAAVRRWTACRPEPRDLTRAAAAVQESSLLRKLGRAQEAWRVIEPWVATWKSDVMEEGATTLAELGRLDEAISLARSRLERYPSGSEVVSLAGLLWKAGKTTEAADHLKRHERLITVEDWSSGAREFGLVFAGRPAEAAAALEQVATRRVAPNTARLPILTSLAAGVGEAGDHRTAFDLLRRREGRGEMEYSRILAYDELRKADGEAAALEWFRKEIPLVSNQMAIILMQERRFDMLLEMTPGQEGPAKNDVLKLFRAAALHYTKRLDHPSRKALAEYFEKREPKTDLVACGLYMTGSRDETIFPRKLKDLNYVASIGWLRGLKAAGEGRFHEANLWFQASLESGQDSGPPHRYSYDIERIWLDSERPLLDLQKDGVF